MEQPIEYEWKPLYYNRFHKPGHNCDQPKPKTKQWKPKTKNEESAKATPEVVEDIIIEALATSVIEPVVIKDNSASNEEPNWTEVNKSGRDRVAWNVRGLNKSAKLREISSRLLELKAHINILIETRVKQGQADTIRNKLHLGGKFIDNYSYHPNGRIWVHWDPNHIDLQVVTLSSQMIHMAVYNNQRDFMFWLTAIYGLNRLDQRKVLWKELDNLNIQGPWCLAGDFNNVLCSQDKIGGKIVIEAEFKDLEDMMRNNDLAEMTNNGDYYTWSNKHNIGTIYSIIDKILGNTDWQKRFRFLNCLTESESYHQVVQANWSETIEGGPSFVLWHKLKRLQKELYKMNKPLISVKQKIIQARENLTKAQKSLSIDKWNFEKIATMKRYNEDLIKWHEIDESIMKQRSKIKWLRDGDGNNSYFHASVRLKQSTKALTMREAENGQVITHQDDIEREVLDFYGKLMGYREQSLDCVDIGALRRGSQLNRDQKILLEGKVTEDDIYIALKGIDDNSAPGLDGYTAKKFKVSWNTIKVDVIAAIHEYFDKGKIYKAFNCSLVSLIPKSTTAKYIRDFRPIFLCSTFYKILSRILTARFSQVIGSIVSINQAAFIHGQQIHSHILLAYELLKGYNCKQGPPRCMFQVDLQRVYNMINWQALEIMMQELGIPPKSQLDNAESNQCFLQSQHKWSPVKASY
ncbi:uncharacterized protein LOC131651466 [Vicia villosa]|uniref:uncharacterized protein LOC131651466 n=1 Tax=Vicia villosa TaxID=3911 RepID=UPI00273CE7FC|nr:uncharacterized protein LOC131651466 [Vicia villosa]